jgi:hypothetical protein
MTGLDILGLQGEADRLKEGNTFAGNDWLENFVKMPEGAGVVVVRLLGPALPGMFNRQANPFYQSTRIHRVNGKSIHCLKELNKDKFEGDCPICLYYNWLWKESEGKGQEEALKLQNQARSIKPIERYYYNCIVRKEVDDKTNEVRTDVGPKILSIGKTLHKMIISGIVGNKEMQEPALGDVTSFLTGRDFKIMKSIRPSGTEKYPNYDQSKFMEPSAVDPDLGKAWMEKVHDLVALRIIHEPDYLKTELKKHLGLIPNDNVGGSFDPREFQSVDHQETIVVQQKETKVEAPVLSEVEKAAAGGGAEDDFFNTIRNLKV